MVTDTIGGPPESRRRDGVTGPKASPRTRRAAAPPTVTAPAGDSAEALHPDDGRDPGHGRPPNGSAAFALGWLLARLYAAPPLGRVTPPQLGHLPTLAELEQEQQMEFAFDELDALLMKLPMPDLVSTDVRAAWKDKDAAAGGLQKPLESLNAAILGQLVVSDAAQAAAYQLGRALHDTCWLPDKHKGGRFFLSQFNRDRLAALQAWLAQAGPILPGEASDVVSKSLQNWQTWADANATACARSWGKQCSHVVAALRQQSHSWHALLAGETPVTSHPGLGAWVQAGESLVHTMQGLMWRVLRRFWLVGLLVLAAVGGLLYLSAVNSSGTTRVWTSLLTVAGGLGITGASLRTGATKAMTAVQQPVRQAADLEACAWAVTWLPTLRQGLVRRYRLARQGVALPSRGRRLA